MACAGYSTWLGKMKNIDIQNGDALKLLKDVPTESVDLIIADPPYNLGKDYGESNDNFSYDEYIKFSIRRRNNILQQKEKNISF